MYILKKIQDSIATRDLIFENDYTNTIDVCFDDSELLSHTNFSFVKIDSKYDCKIFLFGKEDNKGELFWVIDTELIGTRLLTKIKNVRNDIYYIPFHEKFEAIREIRYLYSRKDIIQIGEVIHPDFI
ncbi:TPA: hypothetical protein TUO09_001810 [Streptococcus equi subsp. zooepidemicus]|uniref:hypothetical protein n=1 Tax=Streptococcus equi TaxID=1336 RepID=UPI00030B44C2|nr:hypothetical protein [Streptococcus equi]MCD3373411.1 hypothetical protein [Streptococcus equi subsp. zooepidemicus]MCD3386547.1 hypothetical protein [Streptococcus equi subsp. zooepidemicus]MCD3394979.1 hypothetical protein [Streptococcus equi subsp. zooepidemicus]MCD3417523.1 hypothetical protein [Streptococcus equi subsp. zooepidemicus]MCD3422312.1 hypothetical protein [Streptococcus equi subsp. zooepidemicus]